MVINYQSTLSPITMIMLSRRRTWPLSLTLLHLLAFLSILDVTIAKSAQPPTSLSLRSSSRHVPDQGKNTNTRPSESSVRLMETFRGRSSRQAAPKNSKLLHSRDLQRRNYWISQMKEPAIVRLTVSIYEPGTLNQDGKTPKIVADIGAIDCVVDASKQSSRIVPFRVEYKYRVADIKGLEYISSEINNPIRVLTAEEIQNYDFESQPKLMFGDELVNVDGKDQYVKTLAGASITEAKGSPPFYYLANDIDRDFNMWKSTTPKNAHGTWIPWTEAPFFDQHESRKGADTGVRAVPKDKKVSTMDIKGGIKPTLAKVIVNSQNEQKQAADKTVQRSQKTWLIWDPNTKQVRPYAFQLDNGQRRLVEGITAEEAERYDKLPKVSKEEAKKILNGVNLEAAWTDKDTHGNRIPKALKLTGNHERVDPDYYNKELELTDDKKQIDGTQETQAKNDHESDHGGETGDEQDKKGAETEINELFRKTPERELWKAKERLESLYEADISLHTSADYDKQVSEEIRGLKARIARLEEEIEAKRNGPEGSTSGKPLVETGQPPSDTPHDTTPGTLGGDIGEEHPSGLSFADLHLGV